MKTKKMSVAALSLVLLLSGCGTMHPVPFSPAEKRAEVEKTKEVLFAGQEVVSGPIDLYEAMARAAKYNLSYRLKRMDEAISMGQYGISKFSMLPKMTLSAGYDNRDNVDASVSKSIATNQQSLEASTSRDKDYRTAGMSFSWNILDFGMSYYQAKQQADKYLISSERRRKALQNLIRDVRFAYWRAVAVQQLQDDIKKVMIDSEKAMAYSRTVEKEQLKPLLEILQYQKTLLEITRQLEALQEELALAKIELARLMNLPASTNFELDIPDVATLHIPEVKYKLAELEDLSLLKRPELAESSYQKRISANETKKSIARLFPGITLRVSDKYDSNSYTVNNSWIESGVQIAWNLVNLISGPQTINAAKQREDAAELQQMTLSMAVISQVNIAYRQYHGFIGQYKRNSDLEEISGRILTQMQTTHLATTQSQVEEIKAATNAIMAKLQRYQTYAHMQNAFGKVFTAAGIDPLPVVSDNDNISSLKDAFRSTMRGWDAKSAQVTVPEKAAVRPRLYVKDQNNKSISKDKAGHNNSSDKTQNITVENLVLPGLQDSAPLEAEEKNSSASPEPNIVQKSFATISAKQSLEISSSPGRYPEGSMRLLSSSDLRYKSKKELRLFRNEIYARNSYIFKSKDMQDYFQKQQWYNPKYADVRWRISTVEGHNIDMIKKYEESL